jgi:hypothetical protein
LANTLKYTEKIIKDFQQFLTALKQAANSINKDSKDFPESFLESFVEYLDIVGDPTRNQGALLRIIETPPEVLRHKLKSFMKLQVPVKKNNS